MKSPKTLRNETYKKVLTDLVETNASARTVTKRYKVMRYVLSKEWSNFMNDLDPIKLEEFLKDAVYIDRQIRKVTEGDDQENKDILEEKFIEEELGFPTP